MPRGPAPEWKRRKEPILDDHLRASIDAVGGVHDPETGWYGTLHHTGCETRERAKEIVQALFRAARYVQCSVAATVHPADDGTFYVEFKAINKAHARAYIVNKHGTDRSKWPYDPRRTKADEQKDIA